MYQTGSVMAYQPRYIIALVLAVVLFCRMADAENSRALPEEVISALEQAGDNKAELLSALDKVPVEQREAMEFLVVNMPDCDLKILSAEFLLENTDLAYRAWQETPGRSRFPGRSF